MVEVMGCTLFRNGSSESRALVPVNWVPGIQNINQLPSELLSRILAYLPQKELAINRGVCRHWRDVIDELCPMEFVTLRNNSFLERKMQLRMKECEIWDLDEDIPFAFKYPQSIRTIKLGLNTNIENARGLLSQVKPFVRVLKIDPQNFQENNCILPCVFPKLREIWISPLLDMWLNPLKTIFSISFFDQIPSLTNLYLFLCYDEWHHIDETYENVFNFLAKRGQNIKRLALFNFIHHTPPEEKIKPLLEPFHLPNNVKRLLNSGKLQFHYLEISLEPRYISVWAPIIQGQNNLVELSLNLGASKEEEGVPVSYILPGILSSISTLESICLDNIPSVRSGEDAWIPFDCSVFEKAVNLRKLEVKGDLCYYDDDTPKPDIINLGQIPLGFMKDFNISHFVCNSADLQTFVDNAQMLESLELSSTIAPVNSPAFPSTGVHGGIIHSFMDKPNKRFIDIEFCLNYLHDAENEKLNALELLYPDAHERGEEEDIFLWSS